MTTNTKSNNESPFIRIIPCLDINQGRVVKGINFVDLVDAGDPAEIAAKYSQQGADELTLLDITATTQGRNNTIEAVENVAKHIDIPLTVGGGIRTLENIEALINAGANKVSISSAAINNPELIAQAAQKFGSDKLVVAIDARKQSMADGSLKWQVLSHGGTQDTGLDAVEWAIKMADLGAGELLVTSMDRDGTKEGFDLKLTKAISSAVNIPVIASGGVGNLQHLVDGVTMGGASGVLAASIFHFGQFTIPQAKQYLSQHGIKVNI